MNQTPYIIYLGYLKANSAAYKDEYGWYNWDNGKSCEEGYGVVSSKPDEIEFMDRYLIIMAKKCKCIL